MLFSESKVVLYFDLIVNEGCSQESNWEWPSMGLDNCVSPNRRRAIISTNSDSIHWRIYVSLGAKRAFQLNICEIKWIIFFFILADTMQFTIARGVVDVDLIYTHHG